MITDKLENLAMLQDENRIEDLKKEIASDQTLRVLFLMNFGNKKIHGVDVNGFKPSITYHLDRGMPLTKYTRTRSAFDFLFKEPKTNADVVKKIAVLNRMANTLKFDEFAAFLTAARGELIERKVDKNKVQSSLGKYTEVLSNFTEEEVKTVYNELYPETFDLTLVKEEKKEEKPEKKEEAGEKAPKKKGRKKKSETVEVKEEVAETTPETDSGEE